MVPGRRGIRGGTVALAKVVKRLAGATEVRQGLDDGQGGSAATTVSMGADTEYMQRYGVGGRGEELHVGYFGVGA